MIFIDGVGIGARNADRNPWFSAHLPFLMDVLDGQLPSLRRRTHEGTAGTCVPLDARLGVRGLPQSGTGQAALYTGHNAARMIGQHFGPYLYSTLKPLVREESIFARLLREHTDGDVALANAFPQRFFEYLSGPRKRMVAGMYAALTAGVPFRDIEALKRGDAVSTDITAERWAAIGHGDAPVITPYEAGATLAAIAERHTFTLFEYFMTDKAGHERSMPMAVHCLQELDDLLRGVHERIDHSSTLVFVTSDHGNMEELSVKTHTRNPVPLIAFGARDSFDFCAVSSISQLVPAILSFLRDTPGTRGQNTDDRSSHVSPHAE